MSDFRKSGDVFNNLQRRALGGAKIPHRVSQPVIRRMDGQYVLAAFIFLYSKANIQEGNLPRPQYWITADIETGEFIKEYNCKDADFSGQPFDRLYSVKADKQYNLTAEFYNELFAGLDDVRKEYFETKVINRAKYGVYLDRVLETIPNEYKVFYTELSLI